MSGCQRERSVVLDLPFEGEKLAIYGLISPESGAQISVTTTKPYTEFSDFETIKDATVMLFENSYLIDTLYFDSLFYKTNSPILPQNAYHIEVAYKNLKATSSSIQIPDVIPIQDASYHLNPDSTLQVSLTYKNLDSSPRAFDYQLFLIKEDGSPYHPISLVPPYITKSFFRTPVESIKILDPNEEKKVAFSYNVEYKTPFRILELDSIKGIKYQVFSYSSEILTFYDKRTENGSIKIGTSTEPDPIWTNIDGGYGYFGAFRVDSLVLYR